MSFSNRTFNTRLKIKWIWLFKSQKAWKIVMVLKSKDTGEVKIMLREGSPVLNPQVACMKSSSSLKLFSIIFDPEVETKLLND